LTATPALHTVDIFGHPVFVYSYREAVVDGYLVDHEPPILIKTDLSSEGISWQVGEEVQALNPRTGQIELFNTPDALRFEVDAFNRRVITEPFNKVVCEVLAKELDPFSKQKTLIFCASDAHADMVVQLLKEAFHAHYGSIDDAAVAKITGSSDKPKDLIRRYKNESFPNVAVTVDLLSTGVDVPAICNIVFLRRMNSRILYDQMIGRATRLCEPIEKSHFRIFDAVGIYAALQQFTEMRPVVANPSISFGQLLEELASNDDPDVVQLVRERTASFGGCSSFRSRKPGAGLARSMVSVSCSTGTGSTGSNRSSSLTMTMRCARWSTATATPNVRRTTWKGLQLLCVTLATTCQHSRWCCNAPGS
jgi:type I restriction enzyme R subunit